jgi:predicted nucleotidyltransferase component of viral defense system
MLQKEAVVPEMIDMIKELQSDSLFKNHILAGGTALTFQIGHRTSTDIDLFTPNNQDSLALIQYFREKYNNVSIDIAKNEFVRIYANGIKVEMVEYGDKILEKLKNEEDIRMFGINEIAAMKLYAIKKRSEPRDIIDIAYLLKEIPLKNMFELYKIKYGEISPLYMKRTLLIKSQNIKDNEWLNGGIKMLRHDIKLKEIPLFIKGAIEKYNNNNSIGENNTIKKYKNDINKLSEVRNINITTNLDNFVNSPYEINKTPKQISERLFTNMVNDRKMFENVISKNNTKEQKEYSQGYIKMGHVNKTV